MSLRHTSFIKSVLLASIAHFMLVASSFGQAPARAGYKEEQPQASLLAKEKVIQQQIGRILRGLVPFDDTAKLQLNAYYQQVALPKFTIKENLGKLPELREELMKELRSGKVPLATQHVVGLIFTKMRMYAQTKENFHPAVRYNAMLVLGDLNAVERASRGADGKAAVYPDPLPGALDVLVAEYQSPDQIDAVRVAALVGIDRHVKLDLARPVNRRIPNDKTQVIVGEMIALLKSPPPVGRTSEGHTWMQRRAIDILAALGKVGADPQANAALEKIVADTAAPISLRCTASEALAHWVPTSREKINASAVSQNLGLIAVKACKDEIDRIAALERQEKEMKELRELIKKANPVASGQFSSTSGGAGGMEMYGPGGYGGGGAESEAAGPGGPDMDSMYGGAGGMGMGMGMYGGAMGGNMAEVATDPRIIWSRRRLKYQLTCVKHGLDGMMIAGKSSPHEKAVDQIKKAVEAALALTDPPAENPTLEGLTESIQQGVRGLAFLAPEAAELGAGPVTDLPLDIDPAKPAAPMAAPAPAAAAVDPLAAPAEATVPLDLPPGL